MPEFKFIDPATGRIVYGTALADAKGRIVPSPTSEGPSHNRNIAAANTTYASATNSVQWLTGPVSDIEIVVPATASLTKVLVVYDAPSDAIAALQLADPGTPTTDVAYDRILPGTRLFRTFSGTVPGRTAPGIMRIDVLPFGANTEIGVGAV